MAKVLLLPGDGIGPEVIAQAKRVIDVLASVAGLDIETEVAMVGGAAVDVSGNPLPSESLERAEAADAILLGAVGAPKYDALPFEQRPERGLLKLRSHFGFYANLRPIACFPELVSRSPLREELVSGLDILIVRELTGGLYFAKPRGMEKDVSGKRRGVNTLAYDEDEIRRIARTAFEMAMGRSRRLCSVDKANVLECSILWREVVEEVAADFPQVKLSHMLVDNAAMQMVVRPKQFDVIVTENMFGDILSDEASVLNGSIGLLPSASLRDDRKGLYEPVHGSAPDIAGKGLANPFAAILSVGMMLRHTLGEPMLAERVEAAVRKTISEGLLPRDIAGDGNHADTETIGRRVADLLSESVAAE